MRYKIGILILCLSLVVIAGCASTQSSETIKIGGALCLTGPCGNVGEMSLKGINLAIDEVNAAGGVNGKQLELVYEDTISDDPKSALTVLNNLALQDINFIIGPTWTPAGLATAPIACDKKIVLMSPTLGAKEFAQECGYIFNAWMPDEELSKRLGAKIYDDGYRTLGVIGSLQNWEKIQGESAAEGFSKAGGEVLISEFPLGDQKDFRTELLKIKDKNPEAIYVQYTYIDLVTKQMKELGMDLPIYAALIDPDRVRNAGDALEGAVIANQFDPSEEFKTKFKEVYGVDADYGSDTSYDALKLFAKAIEETDSEDTAQMSEYINNLGDYSGASGEFMFDDSGNAVKESNYLVVRDGSLVVQ